MELETASRGGGAVPSAVEDVGAGAGAGVSSTAECFPVVHGGIERNSSKVRTRGLQHFQPGQGKKVSRGLSVDITWEEGRAGTFLPLMENGRARMVDAGFFGVGERFATAFMDAFEGHCGWKGEIERSCDLRIHIQKVTVRR